LLFALKHRLREKLIDPIGKCFFCGEEWGSVGGLDVSDDNPSSWHKFGWKGILRFPRENLGPLAHPTSLPNVYLVRQS
jgi:hypothetical protein